MDGFHVIKSCFSFESNTVSLDFFFLVGKRIICVDFILSNKMEKSYLKHLNREWNAAGCCHGDASSAASQIPRDLNVEISKQKRKRCGAKTAK